MRRVAKTKIGRIKIRPCYRTVGYKAGRQRTFIWFRLWPDVAVVWNRDTGFVDALFKFTGPVGHVGHVADAMAAARCAVLNAV